MNDHYVAHLEASLHDAKADRDRLARIVAAVRALHADCSSDWCTTRRAMDEATS